MKNVQNRKNDLFQWKILCIKTYRGVFSLYLQLSFLYGTGSHQWHISLPVWKAILPLHCFFTFWAWGISLQFPFLCCRVINNKAFTVYRIDHVDLYSLIRSTKNKNGILRHRYGIDEICAFHVCNLQLLQNQ